jgi:hypothetical protein
LFPDLAAGLVHDADSAAVGREFDAERAVFEDGGVRRRHGSRPGRKEDGNRGAFQGDKLFHGVLFTQQRRKVKP